MKKISKRFITIITVAGVILGMMSTVAFAGTSSGSVNGTLDSVKVYGTCFVQAGKSGVGTKSAAASGHTSALPSAFLTQIRIRLQGYKNSTWYTLDDNTLAKVNTGWAQTSAASGNMNGYTYARGVSNSSIRRYSPSTLRSLPTCYTGNVTF